MTLTIMSRVVYSEKSGIMEVGDARASLVMRFFGFWFNNLIRKAG